nr:hypothetical protein [uncultured bacterium]
MTDTNENRANMTLPPCGPDNSILETDLERAVLLKAISKIKVMETPDGFYVVVGLKASQGSEWYLTTRRERYTPKLFKDLTRLNDHLRETYPTSKVELFRDQQLPPRLDDAEPAKNPKEEPKKPKNATKKRDE